MSNNFESRINKATDQIQNTKFLISEYGFKLVNRKFQKHTNSEYLHLQHSTTGAKAVLIQNDDPELAFNMSFRTHPSDSSGVFHILEHSVVSESDLVTSGDAMTEIRRSLLLRRVNATTRANTTNYFAVGSDRDSLLKAGEVIYNCVIDSEPSKEVFYRERGHFQYDSKLDTHKFVGTVYGEMLSQHLSLQQQRYDAWKNCVMQNSIYANSSAGDPAEIIDLTYEDFIKAYREFYTVNNAFIGLYGNISIEDKLNYLNGLLAPTTNEPVEIGRYINPPLNSTPKSFITKIPYFGNIENLTTENQLSMTWKYPRISDPQEAFELSILIKLLEANPDSELYIAYNERNLDGLFSACYYNEFSDQITIEFLFESLDPSNVRSVQEGLIDILKNLSTEGFKPDVIDVLLTKEEKQENDDLKATGNYIGGFFYTHAEVRLGKAILSVIEDLPIADELSKRDKIRILRDKLKSGEKVFEKLIKNIL